MNRRRRGALIKVSAGAAPKLFVGENPGGEDVRHYGPFANPGRTREAVRMLNDLLGLRDCALNMPIVYAEQGDLFAPATRAACLRYELGTCTGPCAALVTEAAYWNRVQRALDFLEGRAIGPIDEVVENMMAASEANDFERATWWRDRFDALEWLLHGLTRARASIEALSFVYHDPGAYGEDMAYLIRRGTVRAVAPTPDTPIEREGFRALVHEHVGPERDDRPLPWSAIDEMLLVMRWFNSHPAAMRRTVPLAEWLEN